MFCKSLILNDKFRVALEWIHSQGESRRAWNQSRPINGRKLYRVQSSSRNQQQQSSRAARVDRAAGTHYTAKHRNRQKGTSSEPAEPRKARDNQSTRKGCARLARVQSSSAEPQAMQAKRDRYRARPHATKRTSSSEHQAAQTAQAARVASADSEPHQPHQQKGRTAAREGCHGGSGQRVGSEGLSHERTKFRCT